MTRKRSLELYWWSPRRDARVALWELRRNHAAWLSMTAHGGSMLRNFGDELSRRIVAEVSGRRVQWAPPESAEVIAIGSVLEHVAAADAPGLVWGAGLRHPDFAPTGWAKRRSSRILAVRGALTRDALGLEAGTPLGDPGLIARSIYRRSRRPRGVVVVPHFLAFNRPDARSLLDAARSRDMQVVPPSASYHRICEQVSRAELVLTSSLHGMVVADALDCPVQLVSFGSTAEPAFKYSDYESVFGLSSGFRSFADVLDGRMAGVHEAARERSGMVIPRIDEVVEKLIRSAQPLADIA